MDGHVGTLHSTLFILVRIFFRDCLETQQSLHSTLFILVQKKFLAPALYSLLYIPLCLY